jgi:hypothetical protein
LFVLLLQIAHGMGILKLGNVSMDGTKIKANASKRKAMGYGYANKLEEQLRGEVADLIKRAKSENGRVQQDIGIPAELQRREARLEKIAENKTEVKCVPPNGMHRNKPTLPMVTQVLCQWRAAVSSKPTMIMPLWIWIRC